MLLDKYIDTLREMDFLKDMPTGTWHPRSRKNYRLAVDVRPVNSVTVKEAWPMPHIDSEIWDFTGSTLFACLDFVSGYGNLPVHSES